MKEQEKYYRGLDELNQTEEFVQNAHQEFPEYLPVSENDEKSTTRRDFLKLMGFSVAAVSLAACETPVKKIIPYVNKPEGIEPGNAQYYASTYVDGSDFASILVRCREGRPILIEGNDSSSVTKGAVSSKGVASILNLYDSSRAQHFSKEGKKIKVGTADEEISSQLTKIASAGGKIRLVSQTIMSPSTKEVIKDFVSKYPSAEHVVYDSFSVSALLEANNGYVPNYNFAKAKTVVSFNADFLGSYLNSSTFGKDFAETRKLRRGKNAKSDMSKLYQFETQMSLTGSNADVRVPIKPSEEGDFVIALYNKLTGSSHATKASSSAIEKATKDLLVSKGESIVLSGSNDLAIQTLVAEINAFLGNYNGKTINTNNRGLYKQGNDESLFSFSDELNAGKIEAVIFLACNPVYDTVIGKKIEAGLSKAKLSVSTADRVDETAVLCQYNCPTTHFLESWGDVEPIEGHISLIQPTIGKIFKDTRSSEDSLLSWSGDTSGFYSYVKNRWASNYSVDWNSALELGVYEPKHNYKKYKKVLNSENDEVTVEIVKKSPLSVTSSVDRIKKTYASSNKGLEVLFTESINLGTGSLANNPWVYENPDPVTKVCWDNYVALNPVTAKELGAEQGSLDDGTLSTVVELNVPGAGKVNLPVLEQPGQAKGTAVVSIGFGRTMAGKLAEGASEMHPNVDGKSVIGVDVYPFVPVVNGNVTYSVSNVLVKKTKKTYAIAQTQTHHTVMGRKIVQESTLDTYKNESKFTKELDDKYGFYISTSEGKMKPNEVDIWKTPEYNQDGSVKKQEIITHEYTNHHWGLVIDMNACYGCGNCVTSCHAENNVPVVGKDEILRKRDMHWMRIDRYYKADGESTMDDRLSFGNLKKLENPATDNPEVVFQPIMCQHCNHAPCETVCPVVATTHSSEGLNQMTYNRCIGTRYCANNCPYKVRRFNWFNYSDSKSTTVNGSLRQFPHVNVPANDDLGKMVLNPDVTVRARGVMEKCSMCAQRIQAGKLKAKIAGRKVKDGDIKMACQTSCPSGAIIFGDMNDKNSEISHVLEVENADRSFHLLEELNVKPNVSYLTKVRNK